LLDTVDRYCTGEMAVSMDEKLINLDADIAWLCKAKHGMRARP